MQRTTRLACFPRSSSLVKRPTSLFAVATILRSRSAIASPYKSLNLDGNISPSTELSNQNGRRKPSPVTALDCGRIDRQPIVVDNLGTASSGASNQRAEDGDSKAVNRIGGYMHKRGWLREETSRLIHESNRTS